MHIRIYDLRRPSRFYKRTHGCSGKILLPRPILRQHGIQTRLSHLVEFPGARILTILAYVLRLKFKHCDERRRNADIDKANNEYDRLRNVGRLAVLPDDVI